MSIIVWPDTLYSFLPRGKFGIGEGFGLYMPGQTVIGLFTGFGGIYQRKRVGVGSMGGPSKRGNRWATSRMRPYVPTNTRQPAQQLWRGIFAEAISTWQGLTTEEKASYSKQASKRRMPGYQFFISGYLQSRRT